MTNLFDSFLRRHNVDVGHSFAICGFLSATYQLFGVIGDALVGKVNINLGVPIGIIVAIGLWEHKSWARKLILAITWVVSLLMVVIVALVTAGIKGPSITFGATVLSHPSPLQALVFGATVLPIAVFSLGVLHSAKARQEFGMPNQSPDPTLSSVTPPAGQEPRSR